MGGLIDQITHEFGQLNATGWILLAIIVYIAFQLSTE